MAVRKIHSCDWCGVDSPHVGSVGEDWQILKNDGSEWICGECSKARNAALAKVKAERMKKK